MCNEEEDPKSLFNGWLKAYNIAIDIGEQFRQKPWAQNQKPEHVADRGTNERRVAGGAAWAALLQTLPCFGPGIVPLAPFLLVSINTPLGSEDKRIYRE